jgi:hypothetical protein
MKRVTFNGRATAALLVALVALPLAAQGAASADAAGTKRRAARPQAPALATLTGTITDSSSGAPVFQCEVLVQGQTYQADGNGGYKIPSLTPGQFSVTFQRWGYVSSSQTVSLNTGTNTVNATMAPKGVSLVTDKTGATRRYDYELSQFGYLIPFSGFARSDAAELCAADGTRSTVNKADLKSVSSFSDTAMSSCCPASGSIQTAVFTFKDGTTTTSGFYDSCSGEESFVGRDRDTGLWAYLKLSDLTRITFP